MFTPFAGHPRGNASVFMYKVITKWMTEMQFKLKCIYNLRFFLQILCTLPEDDPQKADTSQSSSALIIKALYVL
jgi:hypothetical protein